MDNPQPDTKSTLVTLQTSPTLRQGTRGDRNKSVSAKRVTMPSASVEIKAFGKRRQPLNATTDGRQPELKTWQERDLDAVYPIIWLDTVDYKIKEDERYVSRSLHTILALSVEGKKELLGLYLSEADSPDYWPSVLADLKSRGVEDILIACEDGLSGFREAMETFYPHTAVQRCIVHQIRQSIKYLVSKDQTAFKRDLKRVYQAATREAAEQALDELEAKWGKLYPVVIRSWRGKWDSLSNYFGYPDPVRRTICAISAVEAVYRQFHNLTKVKGGFENELGLCQLLYAGVIEASAKWPRTVQNWNLTLSLLTVHFPGRLDPVLDL